MTQPHAPGPGQAAPGGTTPAPATGDRLPSTSDPGPEGWQPGHAETPAALLKVQRLQAIGELAASVDHEFNSALASIIGSFRVIERWATDPALLAAVREGQRAAERAAALVRQLVAFARREELWLMPVALPPLLAEVEAMVRYTVGRDLAVTVRAEADLPLVLTDPHRLEVALLSLAATARDVMPSKGSLVFRARALPPEARSAQLEPGHYVALSLRHDSTGVAAQGTSPDATPAAPVRREAGLGLAMVRSFAAQSGGCLRTSEDGEVEIILPVASQTGDSPTAPDDIGVLDPRLHGQAGILLVEANDDLRAVSAGLLRDLGYTLAEAPSAEVAETLAPWMRSCDLLVTAMALPGLDGATLAARLRAERPDLSVIFLVTGTPGPALAGEVVLRQPVGAVELAGTVLDLLKRRRSLRAPSPAARLLGRLRTPSLRAAYLSWHAARLPGDALPRLAGFDLAALDLQDNAVMLSVETVGEKTSFRYVSVGAAMTARLGRPLAGTPVEALDLASDTPGSMMAAYRRCLRTAAPLFESARFDLGDAPALRFERLMLPLSEDGRRVTHLAGVVLFHDDASASASGSGLRG